MKGKIVFIGLLFYILLSPQLTDGLAVTGKQLRFHIDFSPNYTREDEFKITNREGFTSSYRITTEKIYGADLSPYFTFTPSIIYNISHGESVSFKVRLKLPEKLNHSGESLTWVRVDIIPELSGFRAYPGIALSYYVFVLYPYPYIKWSFYAPDANINESKNFSFTIENQGEPEINDIYGVVSILNLETNKTVTKLKTEKINLIKKQKATLSIAFNISLPGDYKAIPEIYWGDNYSTIKNKNFDAQNSRLKFRIGSKKVNILNYSNKFEYKAINKLLILAKSEWNTRLDDVYAIIEIFDLEGNKELEFKSLSYELMPWELKNIEAYFDTGSLKVGEYNIKITLFYEGKKTIEEGRIIIGENIASPMKEIPLGVNIKEKITGLNIFTPVNILIILLIIFLTINLYLLTTIIRKKRYYVDNAVVENIANLMKKYNESYIKETMIKRGWEKEKVEYIIKKAKSLIRK